MQFFYHKDSGAKSITLEAKDSHYLFVVRRFKNGGLLTTSNLSDMQLYTYKHEKKNTFTLISAKHAKKATKAHTNIILAMIDQKDIYDTLPMLNALNVASLNLFYADFSQKNRRIDLQKAQKILQYSCMQCGRLQPLTLSLHNNLESVCRAFENAVVIDFPINESPLKDSKEEYYGEKHLESAVKNFENLETKQKRTFAKQGIIIGCEGGFSKKEREFLCKIHKTYSLTTPHILTSHLTSIYIASLCV